MVLISYNYSTSQVKMITYQILEDVREWQFRPLEYMLSSSLNSYNLG